METLTVFSAFDGAAIGLLAFKWANVPVAKYYASEVDKYAIQVAKKNHPEIIHVGDIKRCLASNFPKIDLLIGGSPCQDLSVAKQNREGLKGARSGLFWHYVRLLRTMKPKYFLLENVASMSKADRDQITEALGVEPIMINAALVSAQQRKRLYWTNILGITQPSDRGILLKDVLENGVANLYRGTFQMEKAQSVGTMGNLTGKMSQVSVRRIGGLYAQKERWGIYDKNGKSPTLVASMGTGGGFVPMVEEKSASDSRIYSVRNQRITLKEREYKLALPDGEYSIRKLTPVECERLQGWPDGYTEGVSNTQRYKIIGNGWPARVIEHIFGFIPRESL